MFTEPNEKSTKGSANLKFINLIDTTNYDNIRLFTETDKEYELKTKTPAWKQPISLNSVIEILFIS